MAVIDSGGTSGASAAIRLLRALAYPLIDRLPESLAVRAKTLCSVVVRDWRSVRYLRSACPLGNVLSKVTRAETMQRIAAWDQESRDLIGGYLEAYGDWLDLLYAVRSLEAAVLLDHGSFPAVRRNGGGAPTTGSDTETRTRRLAHLRRQYHLPTAGAEAIISHHGLTLLPEPVRRRLAGTDFIDAGAFAGESTIIFREYSPRRVYAFEPSPSNAKAFRRTMRRNGVPGEAYELAQAGLGSECGEIGFADRGGGELSLLVGGSCRVQVTTLDRFAAERGLRIGLIKADVEGMGLELLRGALGVVRRDRPVLSLAMYHSPEEFFGQYETIAGMGLGYTVRVVDLTPDTPGEITLLAHAK